MKRNLPFSTKPGIYEILSEKELDFVNLVIDNLPEDDSAADHAAKIKVSILSMVRDNPVLAGYQKNLQMVFEGMKWSDGYKFVTEEEPETETETEEPEADEGETEAE